MGQLEGGGVGQLEGGGEGQLEEVHLESPWPRQPVLPAPRDSRMPWSVSRRTNDWPRATWRGMVNCDFSAVLLKCKMLWKNYMELKELPDQKDQERIRV